MKLILSLIAIIILIGCGEDSSSNSTNSSSSTSKKETIDITNRSFDFTGGIEANTGDIYKLKQEHSGYSMKWLTIANSATKDCKLKIIKLQSDWMDEMESRYQYGDVLNLKSSSDTSLHFENGAYVFPYDNEDYTLLIYFASGGKVGNFVDFTLNCESENNILLEESDEVINNQPQNISEQKAIIGSWGDKKCYSYYPSDDSFEGSMSWIQTFFEDGKMFTDSTFFKNKTCNDSNIYSRVRGISKYKIGKKILLDNNQIAFEFDTKIIKGEDLLTNEEKYFDYNWEYGMIQFLENKTKFRIATSYGNNDGKTDETRLSNLEEDEYFYKIDSL